METAKRISFVLAMLLFMISTKGSLLAGEDLKVIEETNPKALQEASKPQPEKLVRAESIIDAKFDPTKYTLGPDDVIEVSVLRHQEFSGTYPVNLEGKIQYKFVGDIDVTGLTKKGLEDKIKQVVSTYVINPEVNVNIIEFKSKVIYVLGEVSAPGKYYMRSESIPIREAVVQAGLPTYSASMRRCHLITPDKKGNPKIKYVDLYSVLYGGDLAKNLEMHPGEVLYVPATVMAKVIRVISPVTSAIGVGASGPNEISNARTAANTMVK